MILHSSPLEQMVFQQLRWIERRRIRIFGSVVSHLDRKKALSSIAALDPPITDFNFENKLDDIIDEKGPETFLRQLAYVLEYNEARTVKCFLDCFSTQKDFVLKHIFLAARLTGQEAARHFYAHTLKHKIQNLTELYAALHKLVYSGLPSDKAIFPSIRPLSDISVHYKACPHSKSWSDANMNPSVMCDIEKYWIEGLLEILAPDIALLRLSSIAKGDTYGKDKFISRMKLTKSNELNF